MNRRTIILCSVVIVILSFIAYLWPWVKTRIEVEQAAVSSKAHNTQSGILEATDGWGENMSLYREVGEMAILYEVTSSGRDREFGTNDDQSFSVVDLNKSKAIGKWVGQKGKEAFTGLKEGWNKKSKFKESDNED